MRWRRGGVSSDVEDRRGSSVGRGLKLGIGGTLVVGLLSMLLGTDLFAVIGAGGGGGVPTSEPGAPVSETAAEREQVEFVSFVLDDLQQTWTGEFSRAGQDYDRATLVLFRDAVESACGMGQSATGPFYCPADGKVYLDLGFFDDLASRFGAAGEFAQAYVVAHEIGHHVQNLLGVSDRVRALQSRNPGERNALSVRLELQADCLAGVWAHSTQRRDLLESGDIESALGAASAIGDDRLQQSAGRRVSPDSFTHGSSAERVQWFRRGFEGGRADVCDTFGR